jgi:hypothetical protein
MCRTLGPRDKPEDDTCGAGKRYVINVVGAQLALLPPGFAPLAVTALDASPIPFNSMDRFDATCRLRPSKSEGMVKVSIVIRIRTQVQP